MADIRDAARQIHGTRAAASTDGDNPVKIGGVGRTTNPTAVSDGQRVDASYDKLGRQVIVPQQVRDLTTHNQITLTSTSETTLLAAVSSTFLDLSLLTFSNTSATAVRVDIRDDIGGTVRLSFYLAANGGGAVISFPVPMIQATVNKNWTAQLSAAVTDVRITALAVKNI